METREERLAAKAKHVEEVQKAFPNEDTSSLLENMQNSVHFEYDIKVTLDSIPLRAAINASAYAAPQDTLGEEVWNKMDEIMVEVYDAKSVEEIEGIKLKARKCLDGHKDLQERFDVVFEELDLQAVAVADDLTPESVKTNG